MRVEQRKFNKQTKTGFKSLIKCVMNALIKNQMRFALEKPEL